MTQETLTLRGCVIGLIRTTFQCAQDSHIGLVSGALLLGMVACGGSTSNGRQQEGPYFEGSTSDAEALLRNHPEIYVVSRPQDLVVRQPTVDGYRESDWSFQFDEDGDCQNTLTEVLARSSLSPVQFKTNRKCEVVGGEWLCPYTGVRVTDPEELVLDLVIPARIVHESGAHDWDEETRRRYSNDLEDADHLKVVSRSLNTSTRNRRPNVWMPGRSASCTYTEQWIALKANWKLTVTRDERSHLIFALASCSGMLPIAPSR